MSQFPPEFLSSISCCTGFDEAAFVEAHEQQPPVSIRLNPFKPAELALPVKAAVPWCKGGFYLQERPNFTHDMLFQAGCYYVQEAGSMFLDHAIRQAVDLTKPLAALDLCAAPGGKSTLALSLLHQDSVLVANEVIRPRAEVLAQNLSKWGACNVLVTNNDPREFSGIGTAFDLVLVDAPCSGSGLFRKQEDAAEEWSPDNVKLCAQRQKRILADMLPSLKDNGVLIYSTCSYSKEENEDIADWLVEQQGLKPVAIPIDEAWNIVLSKSDRGATCYRFYPDKTESEGFFCALFTRENGEQAGYSKNKKGALEAASKKELAVLAPYLSVKENQCVMKFKDELLLMNTATRDFINAHPKLYYRKAGLKLGSIIRDELIPHHDLALSIDASGGIERIEADDETLLRFMKKENFKAVGAKGWALMCCKGFGLGWIKNLGNRVNNYLPNEYKILH